MQGAAKINVLWHNHTNLPPKKKKGSKKPNPSKGHKPQQTLQQKQSNQLMIEIQISVLDVVIPHMHKDLTAQVRSTNANIAQNQTLHKDVLYKNAHLQPQQYHKGKPKQAHQIVIPEHSTKQYHNTCDCNNDDDFMIAFPITCSATEKCTQPKGNHRLYTEMSVCQHSI